MTRPLFEPTTQRVLSTQGYGQRQLYRRPAPNAACPCPVEWAYVEDASSNTINNNTLTTITFESYAIGASVTAVEIQTGTPTLPFKLVESGWYHFWVDVEWSGSGFTDQRMAVMSKSGGGFWINNNDTTFLPHTIMSDPYLASTNGSWGPLYANCNTSNNIQVGLQLRQSSGGAATNTGARYSVIYLGPAIDTPDYNASWFADNLVSF